MVDPAEQVSEQFKNECAVATILAKTAIERLNSCGLVYMTRNVSRRLPIRAVSRGGMSFGCWRRWVAQAMTVAKMDLERRQSTDHELGAAIEALNIAREAFEHIDASQVADPFVLRELMFRAQDL